MTEQWQHHHAVLIPTPLCVSPGAFQYPYLPLLDDFVHIHRPSDYPPPADALHRNCQQPDQTLKLRNRKRSLKLRILENRVNRTR